MVDDIEEDPFSGLDLPNDHAPLRMQSPPRQQLGADAAAEEAEDDEDSEDSEDSEDEANTDRPPQPPAQSADEVLDESDLPLWMRQAHALVIGTSTAPLDGLGLDGRLLRALATMGVRQCFPVQSTVIPRVLAAQASGCGGDILVSAPTGSGKTLTYALPVIQQLLPRVVTRLRALVLLPTRGLAVQVRNVFGALCKHTPLRVGLAVGQEGVPFEAEQAALLGPAPRGGGAGQPPPPGGRSAVDILVATPGRLVEHLLSSDGFTLQHLRWLIVDEADRLLEPGYQGWLQQVLVAAHAPPPPAASTLPGGLREFLSSSRQVGQTTARPWLGSVLGAARGPPINAAATAPPPLIKMLFSATLTRNPSKLAPLQLRKPTYFCVAGARYATPATLSEWMVRADAEDKPLLLTLLLRQLRAAAARGRGAADLPRAGEGDEGDGEEGDEDGEEEEDDDDDDDEGGAGEAEGGDAVVERGEGEKPSRGAAPLPQTLIFASSLQSAHRLTRLLQLMGHEAVEFSSAVPHRQRRATLQQLKAGTARLVVASDALARGMDVDGVEVVVNYEPPGSFKGYIHRVGRTARAGRDGSSFTLLKEEEEAPFKQLLAKAASPYRPFKLAGERRLLRALQPEYEAALPRLQELLEIESAGKLSPLAPIPAAILNSGSDEEGDGGGDDGGGDEDEDDDDGGGDGGEGGEQEPEQQRDEVSSAPNLAKKRRRGAVDDDEGRPSQPAAHAAAPAPREEAEWTRVLAAQRRARLQTIKARR